MRKPKIRYATYIRYLQLFDGSSHTKENIQIKAYKTEALAKSHLEENKQIILDAAKEEGTKTRPIYTTFKNVEVLPIEDCLTIQE